MRVAISDKVVRHNIELFKLLVRKQIEKNEKLILMMKKSYDAVIHRKTGEIRFVELDNEHTAGKDWKVIRIRMHIPEHLEEGFFEISEGGAKELSFEMGDLGPDALHALSETVKTLNQLAYPAAKLKNAERIFQELSELEIESGIEKKKKRDLIHEAWHQVDRIQAEKLLNDCPVGTYLFRKDEFASLLEAELNAQHPDHPIKCITLTYSEWDGKITEKTPVLNEGKWYLYNDDLQLGGPSYPSIESLLKTMNNVLTQPLYHN